MKDSDIIELWRKHFEIHDFSKALLNIEREICAKIAEENEQKHRLKKVDGNWEWVSPAAEAIRARIK